MQGEKITFQNGKLNVPSNPIIPFIEGDGIGPDIWAAAVRVIDTAVEKAYGGSRKIMWKEVFAGEKANEKTGNFLPDETLELMKEYLVGIKGPLTTPVGGGFRSLNVALRQKLDLYACVRPVRWFQGVPSPVKKPQDVDMVIFRENTEDIYAGIEYNHGTPEVEKVKDFLINEMGVSEIRFPNTASIGIKPVSKEGTERLVHAAMEYTIAKGRKSLTIVHKGNIMKFTEGMFKQWAYDYCEANFGDKVWTWQQYDRIKAEQGEDAANTAQKAALDGGAILVKDSIADAFLQQILLRPLDYDVIATLNLNGDYISDALAAMVGGIGIAPGANINYTNGISLFEATHGTAPKYKGLDKVNPSSVILSAVMMLDYMGWSEAGNVIEKGIEGAIAKKRVTYDFERLMEGATTLKCSEFGTEIIENMGSVIYPIDSSSEVEHSSFESNDVSTDSQDSISEVEQTSFESNEVSTDPQDSISEVEQTSFESNEVSTDPQDSISEVEQTSFESNDVSTDSQDSISESENTSYESNDLSSASHKSEAELHISSYESNDVSTDSQDSTSEVEQISFESDEVSTSDSQDSTPEVGQTSYESNDISTDSQDSTPEVEQTSYESNEVSTDSQDLIPESHDTIVESNDLSSGPQKSIAELVISSFEPTDLSTDSLESTVVSNDLFSESHDANETPESNDSSDVLNN